MSVKANKAIAELRTICFALPEVTERPSHGAPAFFIREKKTLCNLHDDHHGDGLLAVLAPAPKGVQEELIETEPDRYFRPRYVGRRGWIGYRLDALGGPDWEEVASIIEEAYRLVAPRTLVRELDAL